MAHDLGEAQARIALLLGQPLDAEARAATPEVAPGICQWCGHWEGYGWEGAAVCGLSKKSGPMTAVYEYEGGVETAADFGCNRYKPMTTDDWDDRCKRAADEQAELARRAVEGKVNHYMSRWYRWRELGDA